MIIIGCGFCDIQNNQGRVRGYISAETEDWWPFAIPEPIEARNRNELVFLLPTFYHFFECTVKGILTAKMVAFRHQQRKWDENPCLILRSETFNVLNFFIWESHPGVLIQWTEYPPTFVSLSFLESLLIIGIHYKRYTLRWRCELLQQVPCPRIN